MQQGVFEHQRAAGEVEGGAARRRRGVPTVVAGAHDLPFFVTTARELARVPDAELIELPWAGHLRRAGVPGAAAVASRSATSRDSPIAASADASTGAVT